MYEKAFVNRLANDNIDFIQCILDILNHNQIPYCVIGGLAVNAYAEPTVSYDLDLVIAIKYQSSLVKILKDYYKVKKFPHSINVSSPDSNIRIQFATDPKYQDFITRAMPGKILGYPMQVATIEDVFKGKVWAYMDKSRRLSKKAKDLVDIIRLIEVSPPLRERLPAKIVKALEGLK